MAAGFVHQGIELAYEQHGSGAPALLFVHGWCCDRTVFAPQLKHFSARHRVIAVDLRGHGESGNATRHAIADFADDLAALTRHLDAGPAIVVGHSMGGLVALQLAAAHAELVAALVMIDAAPLQMPDKLRAVLQGVDAAARAGDTQHLQRYIRSGLFLPASDPALITRVTTLMQAARADARAGALQGMSEFDGLAAAARCRVPALHIAATYPLNPPHLLAQWLPGLVTGQTVGAGHFNQLEVPDQVNAMIAAFLRQQLPARAGG